MAACTTCNSTILFGGVKDGDLRFCNATCHANGPLVLTAQQLPPDVVRHQTAAVYHGQCPKCEGPGPVDVRRSYRIWSFFLMTSWKNPSQISCRRCGVKKQMADALFSLFLGWWGFPWGILMTPVQITRNIIAAVRNPPATGPSPELERAVALSIAIEAAKRDQLRAAYQS
jgi:hypothetical protein